jgi:hypothetical protein
MLHILKNFVHKHVFKVPISILAQAMLTATKNNGSKMVEAYLLPL